MRTLHLKNVKYEHQENDKEKEEKEMARSKPCLNPLSVEMNKMATTSNHQINYLTSWDRKGMTCAQIAFSRFTISACKKKRETQ